ncbi:MAG: CHRD domain-containing protein [Myxococcota bacterium]
MKTKAIFLSLICLGASACGEDEPTTNGNATSPDPDPDPDPDPVARPNVVISELGHAGDASEDFVELENLGQSTVDVSGWFFCFGVGDYAPLSSATIVGDDDLIMDPGEVLVLDVERDLADAAGLGLYLDNSGFANPDRLVDYLRWGDGEGSGDRADVAVAAGLWTEAGAGFDFVPAASPGLTLTYVGGTEPLSTSSDFESRLPSPGQSSDEPPSSARRVVMNEVFHRGDRFVDYIELRNLGDRTVDASGFVLCPRIGEYIPLSNFDVLGAGDLILEPDGLLVLRVPEGLEDQGALALYWRGGSFGDPDTMADYLQYGAATIENVRLDEAVQAGLWTAGDFVPSAEGEAESLSLLRGEENLLSSPSDYESQALSFGFPNPAADLSGIAALSPDVEVPPVQVDSQAEGRVVFAVWNGLFAIAGSFEGLSGPLFEPAPPFGPGHVHRGLRQATQSFEEATGPIAHPLTIPSQGPEDRASVLYGRFNLVEDSELAPEATPEDFVQALQEAQFYVNIHTETNRPGELRAQIDLGDRLIGPGLARDVALSEVSYLGGQGQDFVELVNLGPGTVDVSSWQFCFAVGAYDALSSATIIGGGDLVLEPGEVLTLESPRDIADVAGLGLYDRGGAFANPDTIVDYVRWGSSDGAGDRADVAVAAGIWSETAPGVFDFAPQATGGDSLQLVGGVTGVDSSSADYVNGAPSPGS